MHTREHTTTLGLVLGALLLAVIADCGGKTDGTAKSGTETNSAGSNATGGQSAASGGPAVSGSAATTPVAAAGNTSAAGGTPAVGGAPAAGGTTVANGGALTSTPIAQGGTSASSRSPTVGGAVAVGGSVSLGGTTSTGTRVVRGGSDSTGGRTSTGGSRATGGASLLAGAAGAVAGASPIAPRPPSSHRALANSCVGVHAPAEPASADPLNSSCTKHSDCTKGTNGKCVAGIGMAARMYSCTYDTCATDADCDPGKICYCTASSAARCLSIANCQIDADCGGGPYSYCSPSMSWDCGGYRPIDGYHCHTAADTCLDDSDCPSNPNCTSNSCKQYCNFDVYSGNWRCTATNNTCIIG